MHCPRCGQQQVSIETKFCSRCGFQLGLVSELLSHGGFLPKLAELDQGKTTIFSRKNGVVFSSLWFIFWVMMIPAVIGVLGGADEAAGIAAVFGLFTTVMFMIISLAFLKKPVRPYPYYPGIDPARAAAALHQARSAEALPPQRSIPVTDYVSPPAAGNWRDTNDLKTPGSVTESTTKLLHHDE